LWQRDVYAQRSPIITTQGRHTVCPYNQSSLINRRKTMKKFQTSTKIGFAIAAMCALALAALVWAPVQKTTSANALPTAAKVTVEVIITIGKPSTCTGFGICKIKLGGTLSKQSVKGTLTAEDDGKLSISIPGKAPGAEPAMVLDRDLLLSSDIANKLGLKSATITSGSYPFSGGKAVFNARLVR
jgi:hypothetical protein